MKVNPPASTAECILMRQETKKADRTFEIEFLDPGAQVFALLFGRARRLRLGLWLFGSDRALHA